jgi:pilus assembly protein CpaE
MLDALDGATSIIVVTSQELGALRSAARMAHALRHRYGPSRVRVVVNRFDKRSEIGQPDVERVVGGTVSHTIPSDYPAALEALNAGRPVAMERDQRLARAIRAFAADIAGVTKPAPEPPSGMLGRLAWRRA